MNLLLFSLFFIAIGVWFYNQQYTGLQVISSNGYIIPNNPFYHSGNKQQRSRKHNMLRISKMRKK